MSRRRLSQSELVHGLAAAFRGSVAVGTRLEGQLDAGDGLVAVVAIEIQRGLAPAERARLHGIALATIEQSPELTLRCACRVNRGGKWHTARPERDCPRRPSHALVYRGAWSERELVTLVCSRHAEHPGPGGGRGARGGGLVLAWHRNDGAVAGVTASGRARRAARARCGGRVIDLDPALGCTCRTSIGSVLEDTPIVRCRRCGLVMIASSLGLISNRADAGGFDRLVKELHGVAQEAP